MRMIILLIAIVAGGWYWQKHHASGDLVLDEAGNPAVLVYTAQGCAPCQDTLDMLNARGVPYQEKLIDPNNEQDDDVQRWRRVGGNMLPVTMSGSATVKGSSKWELIGLLGQNFGDQYLTTAEREYFAQHFDANGAPAVVLYGTSWCPGCAALRTEFQQQGVAYVDIDVERRGDFDNLIRVMEIPGYPATWVGYTRVHGTTYSAVKAVMNKGI